MDWAALAFALLFGLFALGCLFLVIPGLPGTWLFVGAALAVELLDAWATGRAAATTFGWGAIAWAIGLCALGEGIEFVAGAAGTRYYGGTRRGMVGAFVGGLLGAVFFTPLFPVPVLGTLLGALLGTFVGAFAGELSHPERRGHRHRLRASFGAVVGRLGGTLGKLATGAAAWLVLVAAAWPG